MTKKRLWLQDFVFFSEFSTLKAGGIFEIASPKDEIDRNIQSGRFSLDMRRGDG